MEQVVGVVLPLDVDQALVVSPVVRPDPTLVVARHEVDVAALLRVRGDGVVVVAHPLRVRLVLRGVGPPANDHRGEGRIAVRERRRVWSHAARRSVDRVDVHRGVHDGHLGPVRHVRRDRLVRELLGEVRLPVVLELSRRIEGVERAVERRVRSRPDMLRDDRCHVVERLERGLALLDGSGPATDQRDERVPVTILGDERQRRRDLERREHAHLLRRVLDVVAVELQDVLRFAQLVEHGPAVDVLDRMQLELERRDDAVVPAPAAERPEEIVVLPVGRVQLPAVRGDHVGRQQVVERQTEPSREVADPATQRQPADAGGRDDAAGGGQPEGVRRVVEVTPRRATLRASRLGARIDLDAPHAGEIDDHTVVDRSEPGHAVTTPAYGKLEPCVPCEVDGRHHVAGGLRANDRGRTPVDHAVEYAAGLVVPIVPGSRHPAPDLFS